MDVVDPIQEIIDSPTELWLNSPDNYPFGQRVNKNDVGGLKSFMISVTPDETLQEFIRGMSHYDLIASFLSNGFSFKETWRPPTQISEDESVYAWSRRQRGNGNY